MDPSVHKDRSENILLMAKSLLTLHLKQGMQDRNWQYEIGLIGKEGVVGPFFFWQNLKKEMYLDMVNNETVPFIDAEFPWFHDNGLASLDTFGEHRTVLYHTEGSLSEIGCKSYLEIE